MNKISVKGARTHNLKNITVEIPREKLIVITGLSGSGKSSLAFDTIYAEGQRRYVESLSAYARQFLSMMEKPDVDQIDGLSPAISIEQKSTSHNPRSTVGTVTEIYDYLRLLFARIGVPVCPDHEEILSSKSISEMCDEIIQSNIGAKILKPKRLTNSINYFFGEDQARYLIEIDKKNLSNVENILRENNVFYENIGITQPEYFEIENELKIETKDLF